MALFHRKEQQQTEVLYSIGIGSENTKLIVGLGNPGKKYEGTRHNIGFDVLESYASADGGRWQDNKRLKSLVCELRIGQSRILLVKPATYMNRSGEAVQAVQSYYKIDSSRTIIVHDELDIPFGQIRTRTGGNAAGHNGIKSVIGMIGEEFGRVRVGIKNDVAANVNSTEFVLKKFNKEEQANLGKLRTEAVSILNEFVFGDKLESSTRNFLS